ncbi:recombinase family protein [Sphingomonas sp. LH128]|uniref:recombinase family protein n=1 Tax=Sphingomonas sp. LH128 TaxID=473781 RepID=UPI002E14EED5
MFRDFAAGAPPRTIARKLNEEHVPGPGGKPWNDTTIRGHVKRGTGIVNNELYIGRLIWNRLRYIKDPSTGKRVSRLNPEADWIIREVPELRIIDDELWQSVRTKHEEIAEKFVNITAAIQSNQQNLLNGGRRPRTMLSGLVYCGCCGGPYSLRGANRFACSTHISKGTCDNNRTIRREDLETRVIAGLKDRMMAPDVVAEAMRAYAEETNRLNRERRSMRDTWTLELKKVVKDIDQIIDAITEGMFHPSMKDKMTALEARKAELNVLLSGKPDATPDILPSAAVIYAEKVASLTRALSQPDESHDASEALRQLIEKIVLTPAPERGEMFATLHGELNTILRWVEHQETCKNAKGNRAKAGNTGVSVSVVAGVGFEPTTFRL